MKKWIALLCAAWALAACTSLFGPPAIHLGRSDISQRAFVDRAQVDLQKVFGQFQGVAISGPGVGVQTVNGSTLTKHWRYAAVIIAVVAAAMPGADPVTTGLETAPLVVLYLASIVLLRTLDRRAARRERQAALTAPPGIGLGS